MFSTFYLVLQMSAKRREPKMRPGKCVTCEKEKLNLRYTVRVKEDFEDYGVTQLGRQCFQCYKQTHFSKCDCCSKRVPKRSLKLNPMNLEEDDQWCKYCHDRWRYWYNMEKSEFQASNHNDYLVNDESVWVAIVLED